MLGVFLLGHRQNLPAQPLSAWNFWAEVGVVWLWRCQTDLVELELKMLQLLVLKLYECLLTKDLQMSLVCWWMVLCVLSWELG